MLRISAEKQGKETRILHLEGKICKTWIGELKTEIEKGLEAGNKIVLDFSRVAFIDEEAAAMINRFPQDRIEKRNCSLFIRSVLKIEKR